MSRGPILDAAGANAIRNITNVTRPDRRYHYLSLDGGAIYAKSSMEDPDVQAAVAEVAQQLGDTGRILVRESGTEPVIRVMVEAESKEVCEKYVDQVVDTIKRKGHAV